MSDDIEFNRDVRPILSDKCFFCHGPDSARREAELRLDDRDAAVSAAAIVPGAAADSELLRRVSSADPDIQMPPPSAKLGRLSDREVDILRRWIDSGAEYQGHWAFLPPRRTLTDHGDSAATRELIDDVIARRLHERGLQPQPAADRNILIRRLSFDLTGLPPQPADIDAFVSDESPQAVETLVDRLLASPAYGERMTVDWLDSARYADSFGFQVDREREMWPWRDWVIAAFNNNLPFDEFLTWQLAGDLLPEATDEQVIATAFNRLHQQEAEGGSVEEEYRVEYVCDRVQTVATTFLGLTFECARCHDHKFDPITQKEYYQVFAMFQNIDEAGLYSYFTNSSPTPAFTMSDAGAKTKLEELTAKVAAAEARGAELHVAAPQAFSDWLETGRVASTGKVIADDAALGSFAFDALDGDRLTNSVHSDQPALLRGDNRLVNGRSGQAVQFTGDEPVDLPFGNFRREEPFTISLWIHAPKEFERAVVLHRSRAWTDAASRGYELLIEDGRLKWSLIHFWPGNAISIQARDKLPLNEWTHVVVSSDGSSRAAGLTLEINGHPADVRIVRDHLTREITGGGGDNIALGERFRDRGFTGGRVDDLRVFNRRLSALERLATFDEPAARAVLNRSANELTKTDLELLAEHWRTTACPDWAAHLASLKAARAELNTFHDGLKEIMVMREMPQPKPAYVLFRGDYSQRREEVVAGTPAVLPPFPADQPRNRLGLARWLTHPDHPLTARVTVNRVWQSLFGRGLVATSEDFGSQGARPVYPEVLDALALHFIDSGWDLKQLLKTMVLTRTYQQRSIADPQTMQDDPHNDWLARGPRFRLNAEMIRDNALAVSGLLSTRIGGPPVNSYEMLESFHPASAVSSDDGTYRRSLYTRWARTGPPPALLTFDAPRRAVCIARRERTDSPLQALILLNGPQFVEAARVLGTSLHTDAGGDLPRMIEQACLRCLSRRPDAREAEILTALYEEQRTYFAAHPEDAKALLAVGQRPADPGLDPFSAAAATMLAQALLNHDECVVKR
jgi:hypothetical protein